MPEATDNENLPSLVRELAQLVLTYLKQETIEPAKGLARFVGLGLAGSFALGLGLVLLTLGGLRALQNQTGSTFTGHLSWAPYAIVAGVVVVIIMLSVTAIGRGRSKKTSRR